MPRSSLAHLIPARRQRLRFIESVVCWEGAVKRQRVCDALHVTPNHLTRDFTLYKAAHPANLVYDLSHRCYRPGPNFKPALATGSPEEYLALLRLHAETRDREGEEWVDADLPGLPGPSAADVVPMPTGAVDRATLQALTRAIAAESGLTVTYQSMRTRGPSARTLWPHALAFTGYRWFVRAYDSKNERFGDFVLPRVAHAKAIDKVIRPNEAEPEADHDWHTRLTIDVVPAARLSDAQAEVVAREYGMRRRQGQWMWQPSVRTSMAQYFLLFHRLDATGPNDRITLRDRTLIKRFAFSES
jgi:predicted DNA-binding transcriptional regulator YafY